MSVFISHGLPRSGADFIAEGQAIPTRFRPIIRQERRHLEVIPGQFHIGGSAGAAYGLGLAEAAPFAAEEVAVAGEGEISSGLQDLISPAEQAVFREPVDTQVFPTRLVDGHAEGIDLIQAVEDLGSAEAVAHHLRVLPGGDQDAQWRCFLLYGEIVGLQFYYGAHEAECDRETIDAAVCACPNMPAGCALDFGVTADGRTLLIEMNDGYSQGFYGLEPTLYARVLAAGWVELNGIEDALKGRAMRTGFPSLSHGCTKDRGYGE